MSGSEMIREMAAAVRKLAAVHKSGKAVVGRLDKVHEFFPANMSVEIGNSDMAGKICLAAGHFHQMAGSFQDMAAAG